MQIDERGRTSTFPMLTEIEERENFFERLMRSQRAHEAVFGDERAQEAAEKEADRREAERYAAKEAGVRIPLGHSSNIGHRRSKVRRPTTAGKW